jgi:hypothetical protein
MFVIVHDLSPDAVRKMAPVDLATATDEPPSPIGYFDFHDGNRHSWDDPGGRSE